MKNTLCYLDNAATSFPKPASVSREVKLCLDNYCGNAGRGSHSLSLIAAKKIYECREEICTLLNLPSPESVAFVPSCTYGINMIIKGVVRAGDHVLISDAEHNCVFRPLERLRREGKITYDIFSALSSSNQSENDIISGIRSKIKPSTRLLICTHQSNICSYSLPIKKIGALCKKFNIIFAVDTAQSIGHYNINMQNMNIDLLSAPGHKGLYGVQGSAFIGINSDIMLDTLIEGGNGIFSLSPGMPEFSPERYEVGTLPLPAIAGLCAGIREIKNIGLSYILECESHLFNILKDGLLNSNNITVYAPEHSGSTLLFNINGSSPEKVSERLDSQGICVRAGFHCSALGHSSIGTADTGAIRVSFGIFNTERHVKRLLSAISKIQKEKATEDI